MLLRRLNHPGTTGLIFRRVYDDLKRNHIDKFFEEFPQLFPFYRATDHEVILPAQAGTTPSRIVFGYAETETEIKRKYFGPEYMDMFVDQGEQLSEQELKYMRMCCRWPGQDSNCKFVIFFNPGGVGLQYFKRVFKDKEYRDKERTTDYAFIQAYGWDNIEWVRSALIEDGITDSQFYAWTDETRFQYFITRSQYGRELDSLPQALRIGHLMGSLDIFAGQYFDIWDPFVMTQMTSELEIKPWHPKWISIDWGYAHNSAVYWHAQDEDVTKTYRELVKSGLGPKALALRIIEMCRMEDEKDKIDAIYLSPDAFAKRTNQDTIADQLREVFVAIGMPAPRRADDDRKSGWMLMHERLRYKQWIISKDCTELIKTLPLLARDEDDLEDCVKFDGDDPADSARYGLKSRFNSREVPKEVQLASHMKKVQEQMGGKDAGAVHTAMHIEHLRFDKRWDRVHAPVRRVRNWRGNTA